MIFTSFEFAVFFLLVLFVRSIIPRFSWEKWFLLAASFLFYMSWNIPFVGLLIFTAGVDFYIGGRLSAVTSPVKRRLLLAVSLALNLGLLGFFKYTNFFLDNIGISIHLDILLPVGISFFTFQSMSYTIDVYRGSLRPCRNARDFFLFVAFFPQLVAGPIVRASQFLPQLAKRVRASALDMEYGLVLFGIGFIKKSVLSDQIAGHVDLIFSNPSGFDALTLLQGVLGYAVQIYCDFSGYTDMAIGCACIMGFQFAENFQMPYAALNIAEFWRRWHISLSTWLRDYLYVPLGGNRNGVCRTYINLMLTMLLGGLWHGASWNFVLWGALHGAALVVHKLWRTLLFPTSAGGALSNAGSRFMTLGIVLLGWILFRAQSLGAASEFVWRIASWQSNGIRLVSAQIITAVGLLIVVHVIISKQRNWAREIVDRSLPVRIVAYTVLASVIVCLGASDASPFIYFQF